jgi:probable H4MPT-linked C1 transfer pathway protein
MPLRVLGLDIGGANLKAAHNSGVARLQPFELWRQPTQLPHALQELIKQMPESDLLAITMTGELCDCFETRRRGVLCILDAVERVAAGRRVAVWLNSSNFTGPATARRRPLRAAAANWLALGCFAARFASSGCAVLMDVGSTTSDFVVIVDGRPVPRGLSDRRRLSAGELVYTGVRRTPVCALLGRSVAAELFATTLDAYLVLGEMNEDVENHGTADGRPATVRHAYTRLARMLCSDAETCDEARLRRLAERVRARQMRLLGRAFAKVTARTREFPATVITSGSGEFLARRVLDSLTGQAFRRVSLSEELGPEISNAACAYAVAILAAESYGDG